MIKDSINDFLMEAGIEERFEVFGLKFDPTETLIKYKNDMIYILIDFSPGYSSTVLERKLKTKDFRHNYTWVESKLKEFGITPRKSSAEVIGISSWFSIAIPNEDINILLEVLGIDRESFELWGRLQ